MEFKKIVLVGCEMKSNINFYEYFPEAQWMNEFSEFQPKQEERLKTTLQEQETKIQEMMKGSSTSTKPSK